MKLLQSIVSLLLTVTPAAAVDFRWTTGFGQGVIEGNIRNGNDSAINIYCDPEGKMGMFVHVARIKPQRGELVDVQIIVDGNNYPFALKEIELEPTSRDERWGFIALVRALSASKQKSFVVEFPKKKTAETFSLLDARKTLRGGKILEGCDDDSPPRTKVNVR